MADWILVPCLVSLRNEFNALAPSRDHATDGSIGDAAHAAEPSDHNPDETGQGEYEDADNVNEVHAIDVDVDLNKAGFHMQACVNIIVGRHRAGKDNRLQYVIYNRKIWSRDWGWEARDYDGSNPHTDHAHFSARYTSAQESDTRPWGLLEGIDDVAFSDDKIALTKSAVECDGLFKKGSKIGDLVQASSVLLLTAIHSKRSADHGEEIVNQLKALNAKLDQLIK